MSESYSTYVVKIAALIGGISATAPTTPTPFDSDDWNSVLNAMIDYAEGRIYRDPHLDFLTTYGAQNANNTINVRDITRPATMVVVTAVNLITPAGSAPGANSTRRVPLDRMTLPFLDAVWPLTYDGTAANVGPPQYYAALSDTAFRLAPTPDAVYTFEFVGTTKPVALSSSNTTTYLTTNLSDLFIAASMIFASGMMKNFGSQSDNPQQAQSWETQYTTLRAGAVIEEARKKGQGAAWTSKTPVAIAEPPRS